MRTSAISISAAALVILGSLGSTTYADPLAPGKPAGVRAAQMGDKEWLVFGGLGALVAVALIASAGGGHDTVPTQPITVVAPSTT